MRLHSPKDNSNSHHDANPSRSFFNSNNKDSFLSDSKNSEPSFVSPTAQSILQSKDAVAPEEESTKVSSNDQVGGKPKAKGVSTAPEPKSSSEPSSNVLAIPVVTIANVDSTTSPAGMPDRIAPRVDTDVAVTVSGHVAPMASVEFSVEGANAANGKATVNGAAKSAHNSASTLKLSGTTQTAPGSAGNLTVVAKIGSTVLARSNTFSVSSIIQNYSVSFNSLVTTSTKRGVAVDTFWESDSGNLADLNQVEASEQVQYPTKNGVFKNAILKPKNSKYLGSQQSPPHTDSHTLGPIATLKSLHGKGSIIADQSFMFKDKRTGAVDIPAKNSGFQITKSQTYNAATSATSLTVSKIGKAVTANGNSSSAGTGNVSRTIPL